MKAPVTVNLTLKEQELDRREMLLRDIAGNLGDISKRLSAIEKVLRIKKARK